MTPQEYRALYNRYTTIINELQSMNELALQIAKACPAPPADKLRPATAKDLTEGTIIWYNNFDEDCRNPDGWGWTIVHQAYRGNVDFFEALDGCDYDLDGAFIEIT